MLPSDFKKILWKNQNFWTIRIPTTLNDHPFCADVYFVQLNSCYEIISEGTKAREICLWVINHGCNRFAIKCKPLRGSSRKFSTVRTLLSRSLLNRIAFAIMPMKPFVRYYCSMRFSLRVFNRISRNFGDTNAHLGEIKRRYEYIISRNVICIRFTYAFPQCTRTP